MPKVHVQQIFSCEVRRPKIEREDPAFQERGVKTPVASLNFVGIQSPFTEDFASAGRQFGTVSVSPPFLEDRTVPYHQFRGAAPIAKLREPRHS